MTIPAPTLSRRPRPPPSPGAMPLRRTLNTYDTLGRCSSSSKPPMTGRPPMPQETVATRAAFRAGVKGLRYTENPDPGFDIPVATDNTPGPNEKRETLRDHRARAGSLRS